MACVFSALSFAELASTIPVAGSAYTYSYATMGELAAWIIAYGIRRSRLREGEVINPEAELDKP